jgi:hypothetical protein
MRGIKHASHQQIHHVHRGESPSGRRGACIGCTGWRLRNRHEIRGRHGYRSSVERRNLPTSLVRRSPALCRASSDFPDRNRYGSGCGEGCRELPTRVTRKPPLSRSFVECHDRNWRGGGARTLSARHWALSASRDSLELSTAPRCLHTTTIRSAGHPIFPDRRCPVAACPP